MYEYLIGCFILACIWIFGFIIRKDLRKPMIWSGLSYIVIITIIFILLKVLSSFIYIGTSITPGYWNPKTLFDLGRLTGGYAIEDVLFMFIVGGIATFVYEFFFRKKIKIPKTYKHHIRAPLIGLIVAFIFLIIFKVNWIYFLMVFSFIGATSIWIERKDLIKNSLFGGFVFLIIYLFAFLLFNTIFPNFIQQVYNLQNISGILFLSVPLEELLYAVSFGFLWTPIYEYEHGVKNIKKR